MYLLNQLNSLYNSNSLHIYCLQAHSVKRMRDKHGSCLLHCFSVDSLYISSNFTHKFQYMMHISLVNFILYQFKVTSGVVVKWFSEEKNFKL